MPPQVTPAILAKPAFVAGFGGVAPIHVRIWAHYGLTTAERALAEILGAPARIELLGKAEVAGAGAPTTAAAVRIGDAGVTVRLVLDHHAARSVAGALSRRIADYVGDGGLSDAESGLVEFVLLELLARLVADLGDEAPSVILTDLASSNAEAPRPEIPSDAVAASVAVNGRSGMAWLSVAGGDTGGKDWSRPLEPAYFSADAPPGAAITLGVGLPWVRLHIDEIAALEPGDVVLSGLADLGACGGAELVTPTRWAVARADLAHADAQSLRVVTRCGMLGVDLPPDGNGSDAWAWCRPVMGARRMFFDEIAQLSHAGRELVFDLAADQSVTLYDGPYPLARCELVRTEDEIGYRVLEIRFQPGYARAEPSR